jgi:hypothetical protein
VIEHFIQLGLERAQLAEIHYKAVLVAPLCGERNLERPIVAVDKRAVTVVIVRAMSEREICVALGASKHG